MDDNTKELLDASSKRAKLIEDLSSLGLKPQQIFNTVETAFFSKVDEFLPAAREHYHAIAMVIKQLRAMDYPAEALQSEDTVFYFDWEDGVCWDSALNLMHFSSDYKGQQLVATPEEIIPKILKPLMEKAIEQKDISNIEQLTTTITFVIMEWLTKDDEEAE